MNQLVVRSGAARNLLSSSRYTSGLKHGVAPLWRMTMLMSTDAAAVMPEKKTAEAKKTTETDAVASYWGISKRKITREDGTEWPWNCFMPWETYKSNTDIDLKKHHAPTTFQDKVAYKNKTVKILRVPTDIFFQAHRSTTTETTPSRFLPPTMEVMTHSSTFLLPTTTAPDIHRHPSLSYALVILNQPLPRFTPLLWEHAQVRLCADGGANRVYDEMPLLFPHEDAIDVRCRYKPDLIKGDMDSIRTEVLDFYTNLGTRVVDEAHDQDTTDLHKCVAYIRDSAPNLNKSNLCVLVAGALGGRFDHEAGNINVLYRFPSMRLILLCDDCLIYLLPRTHQHEIYIQSSVEGPNCGLVPIGMPSGSTTTTGLQWDLADTEMRFGGLISTSNIVKEEKITVQSSTDLLWTISIKKQ